MSSPLPRRVQNLPISLLHLPKRVCTPLMKNNVTEIGQFYSLTDLDLDCMTGIGPKSKQKTKEIQRSLEFSLEGDNLDWFQFWENLGIRVIPENVGIRTSPQEILEKLPLAIKSILEQTSDKRLWNVIQHRFGLLGASIRTREELGIALILTRERIRQLEARALDELQDVLIRERYTGRDYHVHPRVIKQVHYLAQIARDEARKGLRESELFRRIQERFGIDPSLIRPSLFLVLELAGVQKLTFDREGLEAVWVILNSLEVRRIKWGVERLDVLLSENSGSPMDSIDILADFNKGVQKNRRFSLEELDWLIHLCSSVEEYSEGSYWAKFSCLKDRLDQVERILFEAGEPIRINDITRELNHRLAKLERGPVNPKSVVNRMSADKRFAAIGKSGEWGLSSWLPNTENIRDLMKQCLTVHNEPATRDEIYAYVSERRSVSRKSIELYLARRDDFAPVDRDRWGLAAWSETKDAKAWTPEQVAAFVERVLKRSNSRKIEYSILKQALINEAQVSQKQAQGLLSTNPVIKTSRDSSTGELYAIYQPDYRERLKARGGKFGGGRQNTLMQKIAETTRSILEDAPESQVALSELVQRLQHEYHCHRNTVYSYLSKLDFVEKFRVPNTRQKMCRLVLRQDGSKFVLDRVDDIVSPDLREKVARALSFLNTNDVDVALFLLSKEFEATLQKYLTLAASQGQLQLPPNRLSLSVMIDFVGKEGIITDKAILHFLREKRNDRAHGSMPNLDDRQMMMKHAEVTAGWYIDYIKFFDDRSHQLVL